MYFKFVILLAALAVMKIHCLESNLKSVVVIFRHGDRTPKYFFPNNPYNSTEWPEGRAQLTNKGKQRAFELGKWLRNRYNDFLPSTYNVSDIYVRSSNSDRCLVTASLVLAGLYPPKEKQIWNKELLWQPIPVHSERKSKDYLFFAQRSCDKYSKQLKKLYKLNYYKKLQKENSDLYKELSNFTQDSIEDINDVRYLFSTLKIYENEGKPLPEWSKDYYPQKLEPLAAESFGTRAKTTQLARMKTGIFFHKLLEHFQGILEGKDNEKMLMYSAHDGNIASILQVLGAFTPPHCPAFASAIIFELYGLENEEIRIFYKAGVKLNENTDNQNNNETVTESSLKKDEIHPSQDNTSMVGELKPITLKNCGINCNLEDFEKFLEPIAIDKDTWKKECK